MRSSHIYSLAEEKTKQGKIQEKIQGKSSSAISKFATPSRGEWLANFQY